MSTAVTVRLLQALTIIVPHIRQEEDRAVLLRQASVIHRSSRDGLPEESDRQTVDAWFDIATRMITDDKIPSARDPLIPVKQA
jgi:hypothetical protein